MKTKKQKTRTNVHRAAAMPSKCIRTEAATSEGKTKQGNTELSQMPTAGPGEGRSKGIFHVLARHLSMCQSDAEAFSSSTLFITLIVMLWLSLSIQADSAADGG